jgi:hypothetical protein
MKEWLNELKTISQEYQLRFYLQVYFWFILLTISYSYLFLLFSFLFFTELLSDFGQFLQNTQFELLKIKYALIGCKFNEFQILKIFTIGFSQSIIKHLIA